MQLTLFVMLLAVELFFSHPSQGRFVRDDRELAEEADEVSVASIGFTGDWKETVKGELGIGEKFRILYDGSRLPGGSDRTIIAQLKFSDDGEVFEHLLEGPLKADDREIYTKSLFMPYNATKLVIWFKSLDNGKVNWDSDYGENYDFEITKPSIVFDKDWGEIVFGDIKAGGEFDIYYDSKRLKEDDNIFAEMKFSDEGNVSNEELQGLGSDTAYQTAVVSVPDDAESVIMWFYHEVDGKKKYDSDYGNNYHFQLA